MCRIYLFYLIKFVSASFLPLDYLFLSTPLMLTLIRPSPKIKFISSRVLPLNCGFVPLHIFVKFYSYTLTPRMETYSPAHQEEVPSGRVTGIPLDQCKQHHHRSRIIIHHLRAPESLHYFTHFTNVGIFSSIAVLLSKEVPSVITSSLQAGFQHPLA